MNLDKLVTEFVEKTLVGREVKTWLVRRNYSKSQYTEIFVDDISNSPSLGHDLTILSETVKKIKSIRMTDGGSAETVGVEFTFEDDSISWTNLLNEELPIVDHLKL